MKRILACALICAAFAFESGAVAAEKTKIEDVYDLFSPSGSTKSIWIWVNGDNVKGRVSLFKGSNPLRQKKDDGTPVMPVDKEKCKVVYCTLNNSGGEDNRAFRLGGSIGISKDAWTKVVVSFKPRMDGKVVFSVSHGGGMREKMEYPDFGYARYAKFEAKNTSFKDPGMNSPAAWNCAKFWAADFQSKIKAQSVTDSEAPVMKVMRTPMGISQTISVKKDKEVVITFYVRGDETFTSKK